jgi:DNA-binding transcriptional MerR regulator
MSLVENQESNIDVEWKRLIQEAQSIGLTVEEIRDFFRSKQKQNQ